MPLTWLNRLPDFFMRISNNIYVQLYFFKTLRNKKGNSYCNLNLFFFGCCYWARLE